MSLRLLCHLLVFTIVNCQAQNVSTQSEIIPTGDTLASLNTSSSIMETTANNSVGINQGDGIMETTADNNVGMDQGSGVVETTVDNNVGIDQGDGGKADDLADYVSRKFGELIGGAGDSQADNQAANITSSYEDLSNCSVPAVLDLYCEGIPEDVHVYFKYNTSVPGVLASLFKPDIIGDLQSNCPPGSWCLSDIFHEDIRNSKSRFYVESPFCSDAMWSCLRNIQDTRVNCSDKLLEYLVNTVILLCDLEGLGDFNQECYARTVEGLYVTYADLTNPAGSQSSNPVQTDCSGYKVQMTKTYLCADDVCNYDQNVLLEEFTPWVEVAHEAADIAQKCNISQKCQSDYDADESDFPYSYYDLYPSSDDYDSDEYDSDSYVSDQEPTDDEVKQEEHEATKDDVFQEYINDIANEIVPDDSKVTQNNYDSGEEQGIVNSGSDQVGDEAGLNADSNDGYDKEDRSMMLGLIVMTTALLLGFVGLAFVVYKRFQRSRKNKWGYSQLMNQEQKLVQNDYK